MPSGFAVPTTLTYDDIVARAIWCADLHEDVKGINVSIELIRRTRGGGCAARTLEEAGDDAVRLLELGRGSA